MVNWENEMIQRLRPEDKTKAVGLLGLSVAVFAIAGFRTQTITPQNNGETSVTFVLDNAQKAKASPAITKPADESIVVPVVKPQARINPFKDPTEAASKTNPQVPVMPPVQPERPYVPMQGEIAPNTSVQDTTIQPVKEETNQLTVCGVITGDQNMAIVQTSRGQFIVSAGDVFGHNCKVLSISSTTVKVSNNQHIEFYPVGH